VLEGCAPRKGASPAEVMPMTDIVCMDKKGLGSGAPEPRKEERREWTTADEIDLVLFNLSVDLNSLRDLLNDDDIVIIAAGTNMAVYRLRHGDESVSIERIIDGRLRRRYEILFNGRTECSCPAGQYMRNCRHVMMAALTRRVRDESRVMEEVKEATKKVAVEVIKEEIRYEEEKC